VPDLVTYRVVQWSTGTIGHSGAAPIILGPGRN
jgi:hypothetical protein